MELRAQGSDQTTAEASRGGAAVDLSPPSRSPRQSETIPAQAPRIPDYQLFRSMLTDFVNEFTECSDGDQAVAAYTKHRPDWTIIDITMKGMDGLQATRQIKLQSPDARVLVLTQHDSPKIRRAALEAGASAFVSKDNLSEIVAHLNPAAGANPSTPTLPKP